MSPGQIFLAEPPQIRRRAERIRRIAGNVKSKEDSHSHFSSRALYGAEFSVALTHLMQPRQIFGGGFGKMFFAILEFAQVGALVGQFVLQSDDPAFQPGDVVRERVALTSALDPALLSACRSANSFSQRIVPIRTSPPAV